MSNPRQRPVHDPKGFIRTVFDLSYGARDGSEPLTLDELKGQLKEAGVDPVQALHEFHALLQPVIDPKAALIAARKARLAAEKVAQHSVALPSREQLLAKLSELMRLVEGTGGAVFARKWETSSDEDLSSICRQLERQIQRNKEG